MHRAVPMFVCLILCSSVLADDQEAAARKMKLAEMSKRAEALQLRFGPDSNLLRVRTEPLLRYSDATITTTDGTLWLWERDGRPAAATCLFNDSREGFQWNFELVAMCDDSFAVNGRPGWNWTPTTRKRLWLRMDEPIPAETEPARLLQMKTLLEPFHAEEDHDGNKLQLRLLPRRVHRYRSPTAGVEDGALFLFVAGTNPEVIVQIE